MAERLRALERRLLFAGGTGGEPPAFPEELASGPTAFKDLRAAASARAARSKASLDTVLWSLLALAEAWGDSAAQDSSAAAAAAAAVSAALQAVAEAEAAVAKRHDETKRTLCEKAELCGALRERAAEMHVASEAMARASGLQTELRRATAKFGLRAILCPRDSDVAGCGGAGAGGGSDGESSEINWFDDAGFADDGSVSDGPEKEGFGVQSLDARGEFAVGGADDDGSRAFGGPARAGAYSRHLRNLKLLVSQERSFLRFFPQLTADQPYRLLRLLGRGGFAEVWSALDADRWQRVAVKLTRLSDQLSAEEKQFVLESTCREVALQRRLNHPNVAEMLHCFEVSDAMFAAVLELCEGGSLEAVLQSQGPVPEPVARGWIRDVLAALAYLHEKGRVVHFDVKPANVLLRRDGRVALADFGLCQPIVGDASGAKNVAGADFGADAENAAPVLAENHRGAEHCFSPAHSAIVAPPDGTAVLDMSQSVNHVGTLCYMPPEHLKAAVNKEDSVFSGKYDVWSAGVTFYELLFAKNAFGRSKSLTPGSVLAEIMQGILLPNGLGAATETARRTGLRLPRVSQEAIVCCGYCGGCRAYSTLSSQSFLACLLSKDPQQRPTAAEALSHPYLRTA